MHVTHSFRDMTMWIGLCSRITLNVTYAIKYGAHATGDIADHAFG